MNTAHGIRIWIYSCSHARLQVYASGLSNNRDKKWKHTNWTGKWHSHCPYTRHPRNCWRTTFNCLSWWWVPSGHKLYGSVDAAGSGETTVGWSKSDIAITNEEVRKNETEKETGKQVKWRKIEQDKQCTYEYRDNEARSCNHFYSGKSIKYYIYRVRVRSLACAISSSVACPDLPYFSALSHKRHDFRKEPFVYYRTCFDLLYKFETFLVLRRI